MARETARTPITRSPFHHMTSPPAASTLACSVWHVICISNMLDVHLAVGQARKTFENASPTDREQDTPRGSQNRRRKRVAHRLIFTGSLMVVCQRDGQPGTAQHCPRVTCIAARHKISPTLTRLYSYELVSLTACAPYGEGGCNSACAQTEEEARQRRIGGWRVRGAPQLPT